ncbi:hypothetical protein Cob_v002441 [Colletotrichum orbiculare MAFF 240422]|uniref:Uncharacterized protein n=1 Tax=Colletotrichum orbiculare (strain 104-T / ATCC 96160 / CBS 514.97 / LARS 414 / MAFF 240422) TaxID=1213857 RepID=A0A484G2T8_COLOR|nr:hypothetical protein Cob_v002441 [Colletotrichum orbiculare MAFF 240422]
MASNDPVPLMTSQNIPARFVHGAMAVKDTPDNEEPLVFVDELNRWVRRSEAPDLTKCFDESKDHLVKFEATLKSFIQHMSTRKTFQNLGIDPKDPRCCSLEFVFRVTTAAVENRDGTGSLRTCKDFARKCARSAGKRDTALGAILSMIPNDIYGSVISGGFMTIIAVANEKEKKREEIENFLAEIPKKLDKVRRLSELHLWSKRLHERANGVLVAIFVVLESIVDKLTMDRATRLMSKAGWEADGKITSALSAMEVSLNDFQDELDICRDHRASRVAGRVESIYEAAKREPLTREDLKAELLNFATEFFASNPQVHRTISWKQSQEVSNEISTQRNVAETRDTTQLHEKNKHTIRKWRRAIGDFESGSQRHVDECIRAGLGQLTFEERDKTQWIMSSPAVSAWLCLDTSDILTVEAESAPQSLINPFSFAAALLTETLQNLQRSTNYPVKYPVLSFFCGLRTNENFSIDACGPLAVVKSVNGQLFEFCQQESKSSGVHVDLSLLKQEKQGLIKRSTQKLRCAILLFRKLLKLLGDDCVVFVILDSWSRIRGDKTEADKVIEALAQAMKEATGLVLKVLVLDGLTLDAAHKLATLSLYVPDEVDGWRNGVALDELEKNNKSMVEKLQRRKQKETNESSSDDPDASEGSDESLTDEP